MPAIFEDSSDEPAQSDEGDYCDIDQFQVNAINMTADSYEVIGNGGKLWHPGLLC